MKFFTYLKQGGCFSGLSLMPSSIIYWPMVIFFFPIYLIRYIDSAIEHEKLGYCPYSYDSMYCNDCIFVDE